MSKLSFEKWVEQTAVELPYPPLPRLALQQRAEEPRPAVKQRLALAVLLLGLLVVGLLAVPTARATLFKLLPAGAVRIFLLPAEATPDAAPTVPTAVSRLGAGQLVPLTVANEQLPFTILLPTALDLPDQVYLHDEQSGLEAVTLAWFIVEQQDAPRFILSQMAGEPVLGKWAFVHQTTTVAVKGQEAYWIQGEHQFQPLGNRQAETAVTISENVLVWSDTSRSYRLEGALTLAEALRIAKSLP